MVDSVTPHCTHEVLAAKQSGSGCICARVPWSGIQTEHRRLALFGPLDSRQKHAGMTSNMAFRNSLRGCR